MSNGNWIKLNRKILKWEWYSDNSTRSVFLHALLKANYEPSRYKGHELAIGDVVFGRKKWAEELGLSERQVRTAITHLKETGEISTIKVTNKFTILRVENWEFYQSKEDEATNNMTNERPTSDQQPTNKRPRTKKEKKEKNEKKDKNYIYSRATHDIIQHLNERTGSHYKPTTDKTKELIQARMNEGFTVEDFKTVIDKKCVEWMNTEWQEYLRPVTLFGTKFESYLNAPVIQKQEESLWERIARGDFDE